MPYYRNRDAINFDYPPAATTRANGGFKHGDDEVIGRWVELDETDGHCLLVAANNRPIGVIISLAPTKVGVAIGPIVQGKQAGTTALKKMLAIKGATKVVEAGSSAERGFVTEQTIPTGNSAADVSATFIKRGIIIGSEATTANEEGVASTQVLMY